MVALLILAWTRLTASPRLSPDGRFYLSADPPRPYGARVLLPALLRRTPRIWVWELVTLGSLAAGALLLDHKAGPLAAALFLGLPLVRTCVWLPVLTDAPAIALVILAWWLGGEAPWSLLLLLGLLGGALNEKAPVFAALAAGSPLPLVGVLLWALLWWRAPRPRPTDPPWLQQPLTEAWKLRGTLEDGALMLLPWGGALLGLARLDLLGALTLLVAYAGLLLAQDRVRVYQWGFVPLVLGASEILGAFPLELRVALLALHLFSPWRKTL